MSILRTIERNIIAPVLLAIIFFLIILPIALVMKLFGKDPMHRKFDPTAASYRVDSSRSRSRKLDKTY